MSKNNHEITRREFLRQAACASLGLTGTINTMAMLRLTNASVLQGSLDSVSDDYKALVCIYLDGGNDSFNMLVPMGTAADNPARAAYEASRTTVALSSDELHPLNISATSRAFDRYYESDVLDMGVHPSAPELANMFNEQELAFVCNVGSLSYPIDSRDDYLNNLVEVPSNIGSHNTQTQQWQTSIADRSGVPGWGGRVADLLYAGYNADSSKASMSISLSGINLFQRGLSADAAAYAMSTSGTTPLNGYGTNYSSAVLTGSTFENPTYQDTQAGHRLKMMESLMQQTHSNLLEDGFASRFVASRSAEDAVGSSLSQAASSGVDFDAIFTDAEAVTDLGDQLKMIAKLIAGRGALGNRRQIFFARISGYDTHGDVLTAHGELMAELSNSLAAFRTALVAAGEWDNVVAFTGSDFGRTLSPNNSGTDHAWGGHALVMGGQVKGGDLYGHFPPLVTGSAFGSIDIISRGRLIPSTSVDQYSAPMAKWMGVDSNSMDTIFPNLVRFDDPFASTTANMQFL